MGARSSARRGESAPHPREGTMRMINVLMSAGLALVLWQAGFLPAAAQAPAALSGQVTSAEDRAAQLSNGEWFASFPGTDQQRAAMLGCVGCHTLERVARSTHDTDDFINVTLPRMQGYVNQSIPAAQQLRKGE